MLFISQQEGEFIILGEGNKCQEDWILGQPKWFPLGIEQWKSDYQKGECECE